MTFRKLGVANVFCSQTDACCLDFDTIESTRLDAFVLVDIISWVTVSVDYDDECAVSFEHVGGNDCHLVLPF